MSRLLHIIIYIGALSVQTVVSAQNKQEAACPIVKLEAERLPDLNIPRSGHSIVVVNGEVTVIGGHTANFVPTPTAEYFKDGKWHLVETAFTHDDGFALPLSSGKVLIAGGHSQNMGIGQSFEAELYDPESHTSEGFASLDTKRCLASATELDSGRVIVSGNWHHDDAIEMFDGRRSFLPLKDVTQDRCTPYILRTASDDAIIIGGYGSKGDTISSSVADRLKGEAISIPLMEEWRLLPIIYHTTADVSFIGDDQKGIYAYLLPIEDKDGKLAIARVTNGEFSLLPTVCPIPMSGPEGAILWYTTVLADRRSQKAYLLGMDKAYLDNSDQPNRLYVLTIDYAVDLAGITLGYTDPLDISGEWTPVLTAEGNLMITGGYMNHSNFKPTGKVWLLHLGMQKAEAEINSIPWTWIILILVAGLALAVWFLSWRKHHRAESQDPVPQPTPDSVLMQRICELMEKEKPFLNPELKISDVASALGTNRTYLSDCINSQRDSSFTQFVNAYRVEYAKELLRNRRDIKISEVYTLSGFSSENTFFRIFKAHTGKTPSEYRA